MPSHSVYPVQLTAGTSRIRARSSGAGAISRHRLPPADANNTAHFASAAEKAVP
ncbi:hypothetical protein D3C73_960030 [compost metagenome]